MSRRPWVGIHADGCLLRFPVSALRPFVTREGVHGRFRIRCDAAQRLA